MSSQACNVIPPQDTNVGKHCTADTLCIAIPITNNAAQLPPAYPGLVDSSASLFISTRTANTRSTFAGIAPKDATYSDILNCPNYPQTYPPDYYVFVADEINSVPAPTPCPSHGTLGAVNFFAVPPVPEACPNLQINPGVLPPVLSAVGYTIPVDDVFYPDYTNICDPNNTTQVCVYNIADRDMMNPNFIATLLGPQTGIASQKLVFPNQVYDGETTLADYLLGRFCSTIAHEPNGPGPNTCATYVDLDTGAAQQSPGCSNFNNTAMVTPTQSAQDICGSWTKQVFTSSDVGRNNYYNLLVDSVCPKERDPDQFYECQCVNYEETNLWKDLNDISCDPQQPGYDVCKINETALKLIVTTGSVNCWFRPCQMATSDFPTHGYLNPVGFPKSGCDSCPTVCGQVVNISDNTQSNIDIKKLFAVMNCENTGFNPCDYHPCPTPPCPTPTPCPNPPCPAPPCPNPPCPTPGFWDKYKWYIIGSVVAIVVIAVLVIIFTVAFKGKDQKLDKELTADAKKS